jgi:DtxR family Mn-dependent transcriptional regulator
VKRVSDSNPDLLRYLSERGIEPAAHLEVLDYSRFDSNMQVQVVGKDEPVVLGAVITNQVFVETSK